MLDPILESVRGRLGPVVAAEGRWRTLAARRPPVRDLAAALRSPGLSVIAEVKRRSPSVGPIDLDLDPGDRARSYRDGGAAALSVLTEPDHFGGCLGDLAAARAAVAVSYTHLTLPTN